MKVSERKELEIVHAEELRKIREEHEKMAKLKAENDATEALRVTARQQRVEAEEAEQASKRRCLSQRVIDAARRDSQAPHPVAGAVARDHVLLQEAVGLLESAGQRLQGRRALRDPRQDSGGRWGRSAETTPRN